MKHNIELIVKLYTTNNNSIREIAKVANISPTTVRRLLINAGVELRSKSEAQQLALQTGKVAHPTAGKILSQETREAIGRGVSTTYNSRPDEEKRAITDAKSKRLLEQGKAAIGKMTEKGLAGVRKAAKTGSTLERFICEKLVENNIDFTFHYKSPHGDSQLEVDIMLLDKKTAIEVDGPGHFLPIWGDEKLEKTRESDQKKNGLLLGLGYKVVRLQHKKKGTRPSAVRMNDMWEKLKLALESNSKFVEIEL